MTDRNTPRIIGIGNRLRGDDALGPLAADRLREQLGDRVVVLTHESDASGLLHLWEGAEEVILIDAWHGPPPCGELHRIELAREMPPAHACASSTHVLDLLQVVALARQLERLPAHVVLYGVAGRAFGIGDAMSPEVAARLEELVAHIVEEVSMPRAKRGKEE
ncbi:MAG: hydrogenase maturation protease [Acidobacteriota bacterium]|nr:MAG: hydrogenase maturation protease [Acidobacteriota bacterium]